MVLSLEHMSPGEVTVTVILVLKHIDLNKAVAKNNLSSFSDLPVLQVTVQFANRLEGLEECKKRTVAKTCY